MNPTLTLMLSRQNQSAPSEFALASSTQNGLMSSNDKAKLDDIDHSSETFDIVYGDPGLPATITLDGASLPDDQGTLAIEISGNLTDVVFVDYFINGSRFAETLTSPFRVEVPPSALSASNSIVARIQFLRGFVTLAVASFDMAAQQIAKALKTSDPNPVILEIPTGGSMASRNITVETSDGESVTLAVSDDAAWLSASVTGSVVTLTDTGISALAAGDYSATVVVTAAGYTSLVITVAISVRAVAYSLHYAGNTSFTGALPLSGAVLSGLQAIGITPTTGVTSVQWLIDDVAAATRTASPWDLGAEGGATTAALWDSSLVANGLHSIKAVIARTGASSVNQILQSANFGSGLGWDKFTTAAVTGSTIAGPEPDQTLMLVQASTNGTAAHHTFGRTITKAPGAVQTACWLRLTVKPDTANPHYTYALYLAESSTTLGTSTQFARVYFRLDAGNVSTYSPGTANGTDGWSVVSHSVTANADGSYWVDFKVTTNAASTLYTRLVFTDPAFPTASSYINSTATGAYISWQFAFGSTMTPYVATTTTEVNTVGSDALTIEGTFTTSNAAKVLTASPSVLVFQGTLPSTNPAAQNLTISASSGTAAVTFSEPTDMPWLTTPTGGNAVLGTPLVKSLQPAVSGLTSGTKAGVLRASAVGYQSVDIPIQFNVNAAAETYAMYTSPNGVGVAPVTALNGATTAVEPYIWLAATSAPSTPITLAGADTFSFWNTATTDAEEATKAPVRTITAPNNAYPAGSYTQYTGKMIEFEAGAKNYHWRLIRSGVTSRGNASYNYGTASAHKNVRGLALRMDRYEGKGPGQTDGQHFFSTAETTYLQSPDVKVINVMFGWNKIERTAGSGTTSGTFVWTQVDHMVSVAASLGKLINICISPKKWAGNPPPDLAAQANLWNTGTGSDFTGLANWNNATMRTRYKNILRAFSQRYDSNPTVLGLWTDESPQGVNAAYDSLSGSNQTTRSIGWYQLILELLEETPQLFKNMHLFGGFAAWDTAQMPGGNFERLANAGVSMAWPDSLYSSATIERGHKLMYQYKGRVTGMVWGDSYAAAGNEFGGLPTDANRIMLILRQNVDFNIAASGVPANYGPPATEAGCVRAQIMGFMPYPTSVRNPPFQARWPSDVSNMLAYIRANPQHFAGIPYASNLVNKV